MEDKFNNVITFQQKNSNHQIEEIGGTLVEVLPQEIAEHRAKKL